MRLRPHHILDIVNSHGHDIEFTAHPYGHANHTVAQAILSDLEVEIELVLGADDICKPCKHLHPDGICDDVLSQLERPVSKQAYNDELDARLFAHFKWAPGTTLSCRRFLEEVNRHLPGLEKICAHPKEDTHRRLEGLMRGLLKLGIRQESDNHKIE